MELGMEPFAKEAASVDVGQRLRQLREERGVSMRALARLSGLSANALSMIERGLTSPSVSTLNKLSSALQVPITAFFRLEPARERIVFRKAGERTRIPFMRGLIEGLGGEAFLGRVEAFMLTLENGGSSGPSQMLHSGHEFVFVLRGRLEYDVEGQRFQLEPGDSLLFSSNLSHRWRNMGGSVVNALILISAFNEDERPSEFHLAAMSDGERQADVEDDDFGGDL
jgi:transcriptional regulator with XRE-family HTH domain